MRVVAYGFGMRSPVWRVGAALAVLVAALAVGGCVDNEPDPTQSPDPSPTPLFESDEEALAAAEEAYGRYLLVNDQVFAEGGIGLERLDGVATGQQLEADKANLTELTGKGYRSVGTTTFEMLELQQTASDEMVGDPSVIAYVCEDVSGVDVVDSNGVSVVQSNRPNRVRFEVAFDGEPTELRISERIPWEDPC